MEITLWVVELTEGWCHEDTAETEGIAVFRASETPLRLLRKQNQDMRFLQIQILYVM